MKAHDIIHLHKKSILSYAKELEYLLWGESIPYKTTLINFNT